MTEPYDIGVLLADLAAERARRVAAEKAMTRLAEDARLLLQAIMPLPAGIFVRRPWLFKPVFSALADLRRPG